jgi:DNA (cytosine-5)-methyltransferase 1
MDNAKIVSVFDGMAYKLGSLFDGSGGFPLAGSLCGIVPVWAAEVEPYPIAVTRSRFPNMKHLGDVSKVHGGEIEPVDIITFGSPCQDLSTAGKRAGMKHEANGDDETTRSGLFMEAVRIIKEMREATNGIYPRFALWENVPGAFSSNKGADFRLVLQELIQIVEPGAVMPEIPKAGWAYADHYSGDGWSLAYRTFDSQHWGVPQRRRRIHLVIDLRGQCAGEVLFKREGLRGYFAEGRTPWQAAPGHAEGSPGADDREGESAGGLLCPSSAGYADGLLSGRGRELDAVTLGPGIAAREGGHIYEGVSGTLRAEAGDNRMAVAYAALPIHDKATRFQGGGKGRKNDGSANALLVGKEGDPAHTITTCDRHAVAYTLKIRSGCEGGGKGALVQEDKSATLATNNDQYLFQPVIDGHILDDQGGQQISVRTDGKAPTLRAEMHGNIPAVMEPKTYQNTGHGWWNETPVGATVRTACGGDATKANLVVEDAPAYSMKSIARNGKVLTEQANPICAADYKDPDIVAYAAPVQYIVRRLTPTECARLQGFPDRWGDIDEKDELTPEEYRFWLEVRKTHDRINGKKVQDYTREQMLKWYNKLHTDSAEYKMWGNGIALPPALYCMQGIVDAMGKEGGR